jgi:MFS family permease
VSDTTLAVPSLSRLWTRDYLLQLGSVFLVSSSFYVLLPLLPVYVTDVWAGTLSQVGLLATVMSASAVPARLFGGWACDRWGRRPVQIGSLALFALISLGYPLASSLTALLAVRLLYGLPFGGVTAANVTVTSDLVPEQRRGEGLGYYTLAQTLALAIFPVLAFRLLGRFGYLWLFWLAVWLLLGSVILAALIRHPDVRDPAVRLNLRGLLERRIGWLSLLEFLVALGYAGAISFISLHATRVGVSNGGIFYSLYAAGAAVVRPVAGKLYDRRGPNLPVLGGLGGMALAYALLAVWEAPAGFYLGSLVYGIGLGALTPSVTAMAVSLVPPARRGAATATLFAGFDVGMVVGPLMTGLAAEGPGGYRLMFALAAVLIVPAVVLYLLKVRPQFEGRRT